MTDCAVVAAASANKRRHACAYSKQQMAGHTKRDHQKPLVTKTEKMTGKKWKRESFVQYLDKR